MTCIFKEDFACKRGVLPCNWIIEDNTGILADAIRCGDRSIELLSAGNKIIPIIPKVADFELSMKAGVNFELAGKFGIIISFRYHAGLRCGSAFRVSCSKQSEQVLLEYGHIHLNSFMPEKAETLPLADFDFDKPFELALRVNGCKASIILEEKAIDFDISKEGKGKIALSRKHFFDVLGILEFEVNTDEKIICQSEKSFTLPMPDENTQEPIFCDVIERDFGEYLDLQLCFHGGTAEHEPGEGNYHCLRADIMERPFFKVIPLRKLTRLFSTTER